MPLFLKLTLARDEYPTPLMGWDGWRITEFNSMWGGVRDAYDPDEDDELAYRLSLPPQVGRAFWFRNSSNHFELCDSREEATGIVEYLDTAGGMSPNQKEAAALYLDEYGKWARGEVYGYTLETIDGEPVDSCWGFVGGDYFLRAVAEVLEPDDHWFLETGGDAIEFPNSAMKKLPGKRVDVDDEFPPDEPEELARALAESINPDYANIPGEIMRDILLELGFPEVADIAFPLSEEWQPCSEIAILNEGRPMGDEYVVVLDMPGCQADGRFADADPDTNPDGSSYTNDPTRAMRFPTRDAAAAFCVGHERPLPLAAATKEFR